MEFRAVHDLQCILGAEKREKRKQVFKPHPLSSTNYLYPPQMQQRLSCHSGTDKPVQDMLKQKQNKQHIQAYILLEVLFILFFYRPTYIFYFIFHF